MSQLTGTIQKKLAGKNEQVLDKLKVERERGITGLLQPLILDIFIHGAASSEGTDCKVRYLPSSG